MSPDPSPPSPEVPPKQPDAGSGLSFNPEIPIPEQAPPPSIPPDAPGGQFQPEPPGGRRRGPFRLVGLVVGGIIAVGGGAGGWWLFSQMRELHRQRAEVTGHEAAATQRQQEALERIQTLKQQEGQFTQEVARLTADRDNLLKQVEYAQTERDEAVGMRNLLERVLRKTGRENRELKERLEPLVALKGEWNQLVRERDRLDIEVERYRTQSKEQQLAERLETLRRTEGELKRELRRTKQDAERSARSVKKRLEEIDRLKEKVVLLQNKYAETIQENRRLERDRSRLPNDINRLTKEHQRLRKELADTHYNMGVMFTKQRDFTRAAREFQQVVTLRPNDTDAHYNLGVIYSEHLPDRQRAIGFFRRYLAMEPKGQDASYAKQYIATWRAWAGEERLQ